ncbi:hypothetical protein [Sorangium sp. So ce1078]|uniref:hypothetical protein n=1 Tax=Sorangium sp. So ce1078 TaxID=3133329 RepID=UPI003F5FD5CF
MKKLLLFLALPIVVGATDAAASCEDFAGDWQRRIDGIMYSLFQSDCTVTGGLGGHAVKMTATGNTASGNIIRTDSAGCRTVVTAQITKLSSTQIRIDWLGTDGKCLPIDYRESFVYNKI